MRKGDFIESPFFNYLNHDFILACMVEMMIIRIVCKTSDSDFAVRFLRKEIFMYFCTTS